MSDNTSKVDQKAVQTGVLDGLLVIVFQFAGQLLAYAVTLLPFLDTFQQGRYSWAKFPIGILIGAGIKALDRKRHEDSSSATGLVSL